MFFTGKWISNYHGGQINIAYSKIMGLRAKWLNNHNAKMYNESEIQFNKSKHEASCLMPASYTLYIQLE